MAESFITPTGDSVIALTGDLSTPGSMVMARCNITLSAGDAGVIYCAHDTIATRRFEVPFSAEQVFFGAATEATGTYSVPAATTSVNLQPCAVLSTTTYVNDTVSILGVGLDGTELAGTYYVMILGRLIAYSAGS